MSSNNITTAPARIDEIIFIKNYFSLWKHLAPFGIAALLLLLLSIPTDNLLLQLLDKLQTPSWVWLPALILTTICTLIYFNIIKAQVRQAYLFPAGDTRRTIATGFFYIFFCFLLAFVVLVTIPGHRLGLVDLFVCYMLAVLSLTGIGWSGPDSWVESIGVKIPDYTDGRVAADRLSEALTTLRQKPTAEIKDVEAMIAAASNLRTSIDKNIELEPKWARTEMRGLNEQLRRLIAEINQNFSVNKPDDVEQLAAACRCQDKTIYKDFIEILNALGQYYDKWSCPPREIEG